MGMQGKYVKKDIQFFLQLQILKYEYTQKICEEKDTQFFLQLKIFKYGYARKICEKRHIILFIVTNF